MGRRASRADGYEAVASGIARWLHGRQVPERQVPLGTEPTAVDGVGRAWVTGRGVVLERDGNERGPFRPGELVSFWSPRDQRPSPVGHGGTVGTGSSAVLRSHLVATLADGRGDASSRADVAALARRFGQPRVDRLLRRRRPVAVGPAGGLVWLVNADPWALEQWDAGGILDPDPNTECDPWPPQAMGVYYADAYAAAVFARLSTGDPGLLDPAHRALDHVERTYRNHPPAPIWYHHDFKNAPYLEACALLGREAPLAEALHGDLYEPTNVMAVRAHWVAARLARRRRSGDLRRLDRCLRTSLGRQDPSGLLRDDRPPFTEGLVDLSYHLFAGAFLCRAHAHCGRDELVEPITRAAAVAAELQLPSGEVALSGRGTGNIYHQAAAVLLFEVAASLGGDPALAGAADRAAERIRARQQPDGWVPLADHLVAGRMGWNHCSSPYNALSAYFLLHAADVARAGAPGEDVPPRAPGRRRTIAGPFASLRDTGAVAVLGAGQDGFMPWSGCHIPGVAGTLGFGTDRPTPFLAPERLLRDGTELEVTDLPDIDWGPTRLAWTSPGRLSTDGEGVRYEVSGPAGRATVRAELLHGPAPTLAFEVEAPGASSIALRLALRDDAVEATDLPTHLPARIPLVGGGAVRWSTSAAPAPLAVGWTRVASNPRGCGWLGTAPLAVPDGSPVAWSVGLEPPG